VCTLTQVLASHGYAGLAQVLGAQPADASDSQKSGWAERLSWAVSWLGASVAVLNSTRVRAWLAGWAAAACCKLCTCWGRERRSWLLEPLCAVVASHACSLPCNALVIGRETLADRLPPAPPPSPSPSRSQACLQWEPLVNPMTSQTSSTGPLPASAAINLTTVPADCWFNLLQVRRCGGQRWQQPSARSTPPAQGTGVPNLECWSPGGCGRI
jgi:hypothetical protein